MYTFTKHLLFVIICVLFSITELTGQSEVYVNQIYGAPIRTGEELLVEDGRFGRFSGKATTDATEEVKNRIVWNLYPQEGIPLAEGTYDLLCEVFIWDETTSSDRGPANGYLQKLTIDVEKGGFDQPRALYAFDGGRKFSVKIRNLTLDGNPLSDKVSMQLVGEVIAQRSECEISVEAPTAALNFLTVDAQGQVQPGTDIAELPSVECATAYELEYTFFDEASQVGQAMMGQNFSSVNEEVAQLMRHDATRVTVKHAPYQVRLFNLFRTGVVIFRYRIIGKNANGERVHSLWSTHNLNMSQIQDYMSVSHQPGHNWQASTAFAEDAKLLPNISYQDGTMRVRQNMTIQYGENNGAPNPNTEFPISQRSLYDAVGRPAATVLPAPIFTEVSVEPKLSFNPDHLERDSGGGLFDKTELEISNEQGGLPGMSDAAGAGNYYGRDMNAPAEAKERNAFVPDAKGYPLSVTRFTADNTGRIRQQGNVGNGYQPGEHDTRYFYAKPDQTELDRLFGTNVGNADHYEKRATIDPNGQASVAYIDAKGRTVATALAGAPPTSLSGISAYQDALNAATPRRVDILNNIAGDTVITTHPIVVLNPTEHSVCYLLSEENYCLECPAEEGSEQNGDTDSPICYECLYDIEVTIKQTDAIGTPQVFTFSRTGVPADGDAQDCFNGTVDLSKVRLGVGEFVITKKVWVSTVSLALAAAQFEADSACIVNEESFTSVYVEAIDYTSCETCDCNLPRRDLSPECRAVCLENVTPCISLRQVMLADVSPGGQYGSYTVGGSVIAPPEEGVPSIFQAVPSSDQLYFQTIDYGLSQAIIDGEPILVHEMTAAQFIENWDASWAKYLLSFHPEYCLLDWCESNIDDPRGEDGLSSYVFDTELRKVDTWAEALQFYPLPSLSTDNLSTFYQLSLKPFYDYDPLSIGTDFSDEIEAYLYSLSTSDRTDPLFVMEQYASAAFDGGGTNWNFDTAPDWQQDIAWRTFRDTYLGRKQFISEKLQMESCGNDEDWRCLQQPLCAEMDCSETLGCEDPDSPFAEFTARVSFISLTSGFNATTAPEDIADFQSQAEQAQQELELSCNQRCEDYRFAWRTELLSCNLTDSIAVEEALDIMVQICKTGCAAGLMDGSSTIPADQPAISNYRSFSDVLANVVFQNQSCEANGGCNAYMINYPGPATQDAYYGTLTLSGQTFVMWLINNYSFLEYRTQSLKDGCVCETCPQPAGATSYPTTTVEGIAYYNNIEDSAVEHTFNLIEDFLVANPNGTRPFSIPASVLNVASVQIPAELNSNGRFCLNRETIEGKLRESICGSFSFDDMPGFFTEYLNGVLGWSRTEEEYRNFLGIDARFSKNCLLCSDEINPIPLLEDETSCEDQLLVDALNEAQYHYDRYYAVELATFKKNYVDYCLSNLSEELQLEYTPVEYHYTLYYYDQAGNLSMTVPPEGVHPIDSATELANVATWKSGLMNSRHPDEMNSNGETPGVLPPHRMITHYAHNTFSEVVITNNPDSKPAYSWYDQFGRIIASQDGRQYMQNKKRLYSYTRYDGLGRIHEVGEAIFPFTMKRSTFGEYVSGLIEDNQTGAGAEQSISIDVLGAAERTQFETLTDYTKRSMYFSGLLIPFNEITSRNRVVATYTLKGTKKKEVGYATHYIYDIAGNVSDLVQDFPELNSIGQRFKKLHYDYDLISGNVNALFYQKGEDDQFTYRYEYDKINRLVAAYSSEIETGQVNTTTWKRDAAYQYYDYGPLRRTLIGQGNLQGVDYAYTAQGWIKVVNGGNGTKRVDVSQRMDMNVDGFPNEDNRYGAIAPLTNRDLYRYNINYNQTDYQPIAPEISTANGNVEFIARNSHMDNFYNGNIELIYRNTVADGYSHTYLWAKYDQLQRLVTAYNFSKRADDPRIATRSNQYNYHAFNYQYDANGNLTKLTRNASSWYTSSNEQRYGRNTLRYTYDSDGSNNLLRDVNPYWSTNLGSAKSPFQPIKGDLAFQYDGSGNLIYQQDDNPSNQTSSSLNWTPYGKVNQVVNVGTLFGSSSRSGFDYGPDQNRWVKTRSTLDNSQQEISTFKEYQVRDASGNTIATYYTGQLFDRRTDGTYTTAATNSPFTWKQQYLFGSARLGLVSFDQVVGAPPCIKCPPVQIDQTVLGSRFYEMTDHLGNVTTVFGENIESRIERRLVNNEWVETSYSAPQLRSYSTYTPFGLNLAKTADASTNSPGNRYGFNGKEKDDDGEWGNSTVYDYGFRIYNPGIARFLSVDPLSPDYPWYTPYQFAGNKPIANIDLDGLEELRITDLIEEGFDLELQVIRNDEVLNSYLDKISKKELADKHLVLFRFDKSTRQGKTVNLSLTEEQRGYINYYTLQYPEASTPKSQDYIGKILKKFSSRSGLSEDEVLSEIHRGRQIHVVSFNPNQVLSELDFSINNFIHEIELHLIGNIEGKTRTTENQDHKEAFMYDSLSDELKQLIDNRMSPSPMELPKESLGYKLYQIVVEGVKASGLKKDNSDEAEQKKTEFLRKNFKEK